MPPAAAMPRMLKELAEHKELGLLHSYYMEGWRTVTTVQYWRSFEHLHAYAHAKDAEHLPAWAAFNRAVGNNGSVGVWHESYLVSQGAYECVYVNMPRYGLAEAGTHVEAVGRLQSARSRLKGEA